MCCLANNPVKCLSVSDGDGEGLLVTTVPLAEGFLWLAYTVLNLEKMIPNPAAPTTVDW